MIQVAGDTLRITFDQWNAEAYDLFLRSKALPEHSIDYDELSDRYTIETPSRFARILGVEIPRETRDWLALNPRLFDYQGFLARTALAAKRYAIWADTGLGKTLMEWEWCRQVLHRTSGRVLFIAPLNLIPQHLGIAAEFYGSEISAEVLDSRDELLRWCASGSGIAMVNPEKFIAREGDDEAITEISYCAGVCLDESSLLKTGGGAIKWALIKSCRGVEYKLSCTATPAPNDPIEYASQASWLEKIRDEGEVIWTFFTRDSEGEWKIKDHALPAFYRFLAGWSCYLRNPAHYAFADNLKDLPPARRFVHEIPATPEQMAMVRGVPDATGQCAMFVAPKLGIVERGRLGTLSSGFLYEPGGTATRIPSRKLSFVARLVDKEVEAGLQVLVWTQYDETAEILAEKLAGMPFKVEALTGSVPVARRPEITARLLSGETRVLITRPRVLGFGTNLQCVGSMVFADINDSYEQVYQAERRAHRYGQKRSVRIHFPIVPELQNAVWMNLQEKRATFERDVDRMERLYVEAMRDMVSRGEA